MIYTDYNFISQYDFSRFEVFKSKGKMFLNCFCSFDIETSSFFIDENNKAISITEYENRLKINPKYENIAIKSSLCYIWQFAINDDVFIGRRLEDFVDFTQKLYNAIHGLHIIVYVHNLSYEFQFIRKYFKWVDVFAMDNRKVLYCKTDFIFFKCSYLLSGKSLQGVAKELNNTSLKKLVGDLDYKLLRNSKTPLNETELQYCINDVLIVNEYIKQQSNIYGRLDKIPLTNTGRVRRYCREKCFENKAYPSMIHKSLILTPLEFKLARMAFNGGFTHANALYSNLKVAKVASYDFTSSYPTVMISEKYPMSKGTRKDNLSQKDFENYINRFCCITVVELWNIKTVEKLQPIFSVSKCLKKSNVQLDNGRVYKADYIAIVITDIDYKNLKRFYTFDKIKFGVTYFYKRDYLPKEFISCILELYKDKTELKDLQGKDENETQQIAIEYLLKKGMLNSLYGMSVFNPIKTQYIYNDDWKSVEKEVNEKNIGDYNDDKSRFTFYLWGVFVTSYARNNLFTGIYELKDDFIYCDTDSVKALNCGKNDLKHKKYFIKYNNDIYQKMKKCLVHYGFDEKLLKPKNNKGKEKLLGIWDFEGEYDFFKTLGAKRYLIEKNGKLDLTISGVNKKIAMPYLLEKYKTNDKIFDVFTNDLYFPKEYTGKRIHTYIDEEQSGLVTDYLGNTDMYETKSGIHLIESDYSLSLLADYLYFFKYVQKCSNIV